MYGICAGGCVSEWMDGWPGKVQCEICECEGVSSLRLVSSSAGSRYSDTACALRRLERGLERWDGMGWDARETSPF